MFFEGQNIGHDLAGVCAVCQTIDHRYSRKLGHFKQRLFLKRTDHDHIDIAA